MRSSGIATLTVTDSSASSSRTSTSTVEVRRSGHNSIPRTYLNGLGHASDYAASEYHRTAIDLCFWVRRMTDCPKSGYAGICGRGSCHMSPHIPRHAFSSNSKRNTGNSLKNQLRHYPTDRQSTSEDRIAGSQSKSSHMSFDFDVSARPACLVAPTASA
jgi:hypothetical protein